MLASLSGDKSGDTALSSRGKPLQFGDLSRREFVVRLGQSTAVAFIPSRLWNFPLLSVPNNAAGSSDASEFFLRPSYRNERPLDAMLRKVPAGSDRFLNEKYAEEIAAVLAQWTAGLLRSPRDVQPIANALAAGFRAASVQPTESRVVRSSPPVEVRRNTFTSDLKLDREAFLREWQKSLQGFSNIKVAELQVTRIEARGATESGVTSRALLTEVRYEIAGSGAGFHCEQRVGSWRLNWESSGSEPFRLRTFEVIEEARARSNSPFYADATAAALGRNPSYSSQLVHGSDYWRTILDGACGIDVYGHNGVSLADINGDGLDDLFICQPAGLPNRVYRNLGDGTFEDATESSGLGLLENTVCALFADFNNDGHQDVVLVRANGPALFVNDGGGRFEEKTNAFHFANPPQGAFTGAAAADYDRDGWLDIYFCLYSYYQGTGQYRYPSPYHDAQNGPPNFLMRNNRDGSFRDVTGETGLNENNTRYSFCCSWDDYNRDGWPDLYVVNDFGRKNLYHNNGDGTFTDVAPQSKTEDVGAGMSVAWLDFNSDGADDLYIANMWTAAGLRVSMQDVFKKDSSGEVRGLYQKHAMGNSLLRNQNPAFADVTSLSGAAIGRWAWSSDALDFDHDGYPDIYIANGMVSGASRSDLNSFFWRQVVANSPDDAAASHEYEQGWTAINELIREDGTWSGYERNIFYANNRDGTFSDVSAAIGLDFIEDSRSFAVGDFDQDGRVEIFLKNRSAPQLRILKNIARDLPPSVVFRLHGTKSNRDAVGASVTIESGGRTQTQTVRVGSGFLSQHSKEVFFGLGDLKGPLHARVQWPSGNVQQLQDIPINHRIWVEEGRQPSRMEPFRITNVDVPSAPHVSPGESLPLNVETWLLAPIPAPDFSLTDIKGNTVSPSSLRGKPALLHFWTSKSGECIAELRALQRTHARWPGTLLSINMDQCAAARDSQDAVANQDLAALAQKEGWSFPVLRGSDDLAAIYNILYRQIFDRHRDLGLPSSFLLDEQGNIVKIYRGPITTERIQQDFRSIPRSDQERLARGLPFTSANSRIPIGRNYLSLGAQYFQRGYLDQAASSFQQSLGDDPSSAEALYGLGSVYLNQNKNAPARDMFERCLKQQASFPDTHPDAWNNLGVIATRESNLAEAVGDFEQALKLNPNHLLSLNNLGNAYRAQKQWSEARKILERALAIAPEDPEANYSLGMVYAQMNDTDKAYEYLQRALKARPDYPEALNNLGVLYLVTRRPEQAVESFQQAVRVAPSFDQSYLNLARVYVLQGARDQAREVLQNLLKQHPNHVQAKQMLEQLQQ